MCCQIFVPEKFRRKIHADGQGSFCLVFFSFYFTSCYNSNVLSRFGVLQYNSLNVQS